MGARSRNLRVAVALGLVLALGSVGELPHRHLEAAVGTDLALTEIERPLLTPTAAADDTTCPACVLQRLLSQAHGVEGTALEKPSPAGTIAEALDPLLVDAAPSAGGPRGPPPTV